MSVASVHPNNPSVPQSYQRDAFDDFTDHYYGEPAVLSIEEIRLQLYSCFTCGVSWLQDHVCLDCSECGGYSLQRPCPLCDGQCASPWKRDLTMSHACGKARWNGKCQLQSSGTNSQKILSKQEETGVCSHFNKLSLKS